MGLHPFLRHQCAFCVTILAPDELTRLGPLGQPEKAIGHEPQIEPWLAPDNRFACRSQS